MSTSAVKTLGVVGVVLAGVIIILLSVKRFSLALAESLTMFMKIALLCLFFLEVEAHAS